MFIVGFQVLQDLIGNVDVLQLEAASAFEISGLCQHLKDRGSQPSASGIIPMWHVRITSQAAIQKIGKVLVGQSGIEESILFRNHNLQKVAQQRAVFDGRCEGGMYGDRPSAIPDQLPQTWPHCFQSSSEQSCQSLGRCRSASLKNVSME